MRRRTAILIVTALMLAAVPALAAKAVEGSGKLETRSFDLPTFTRIALGGAFSTEIVYGEAQSVEITVDDNLWDILEAEVDGKELTIDWDKNCRSSEGCRVRVTVTRLEQFAMHGAGDTTIRGARGEHLALIVRGAGDVTVDGRVDALDLMVTGAGNCHADGLEAKDVKVVVSGVGDCEVHAVDSLDVKVSGVGNVTYRGEPASKHTDITGMGSVNGR